MLIPIQFMGFQYQIDKAYLQVFLSIICRLVIDINLTGIFETLVCISSNVSWLFVCLLRFILVLLFHLFVLDVFSRGRYCRMSQSYNLIAAIYIKISNGLMMSKSLTRCSFKWLSELYMELSYSHRVILILLEGLLYLNPFLWHMIPSETAVTIPGVMFWRFIIWSNSFLLQLYTNAV